MWALIVELQMENYRIRIRLQTEKKVNGFKWRTLVVSGFLQVKNNSGWLQMENGGWLRTENDIG